MKAPFCKFSELKPGTKARVVNCGPECICADRLMELGLTPGAEFEVTKTAPFGDPVEIQLRGSSLCLRKSESQGILVEAVDLR